MLARPTAMPRVEVAYMSQDQSISGSTRNRKPKSKPLSLMTVKDIDSDFIYNMDHINKRNALKSKEKKLVSPSRSAPSPTTWTSRRRSWSCSTWPATARSRSTVTRTLPSPSSPKRGNSISLTERSTEESKPQAGKKSPVSVPEQPEAPHQQLYCICRTADDSYFMIGCDKCEGWYHPECLGLDLVMHSSLTFRPE